MSRRASAFFVLALLGACASMRRGEESPEAARIRAGMARLGASEERGACFADRLEASLSRKKSEEAAALIEAARSREDMRERVLDSSEAVQRAFIRANMGCSLFG